MANFTLAVNRKFNKEEVDFIDVVVWRGLAENCANYLSKGKLAAVEGRLQVRNYETKEGQKRKVTVDDVRFLSPSGSQGEQNRNHDQWDDLGREVRLEDVDMGDGFPY